jgi:hypothetical protein
MAVRVASKRGAGRVECSTVVHQSEPDLRVPGVATASIVMFRASELRISYVSIATNNWE